MDPPPTTATDPFVLYLLAEKERLLGEKEELLDSKDKLWRHYYDIIREKDQQIERLRQEAKNISDEKERFEKRCHQFADAWENVMGSTAASEEPSEQADDEADEEDEEEWYLSNEYRNKLFNDTGTPWALSKENQIAGAMTTAKPPGAGAKMPPTPATITVPKPIALVRPNFDVEPLLGPGPGGSAMVGASHQLAQEVRDSIEDTFREIAQRNAEGRLPAHPTTAITSCAHMWSVDASSKMRWTLDTPRRHTCYTCFNKRKPCLFWRGSMRWWVLPLPKELQPPGCMYTDKEYYIYSGQQSAATFPGIWEASKKKKKKPKKDRLMLAGMEI